MDKYEVSWGPEGEAPTRTEIVTAEGHEDAIKKVLEPFKTDPHSVDAQIWNVKSRKVSDADRT